MQKYVIKKRTFARVAGKDKVHIPASSVVPVLVRGKPDRGNQRLLEPLNIPLPGGLVVLPTLVDSSHGGVPVQIINLTQEDVWLCPRTRLGVFSPVEWLSDEPQVEVKFHRISAGTEHVCIDPGGSAHSSMQAMLDSLDIGDTEGQKQS